MTSLEGVGGKGEKNSSKWTPTMFYYIMTPYFFL